MMLSSGHPFEAIPYLALLYLCDRIENCYFDDLWTLNVNVYVSVTYLVNRCCTL